MQIYRFRDCLLNTAERSVIRGREHIELTTKTFDVLEFLIENRGKVVTKDELLGNVWNGNFVEESNLPVHISKLRRSLEETRDNRFIETVQGTGYRFVAPVHEVDEDEWRKIFARSDAQSGGSGATIQSIAVLPLRNESGDSSNDYLIDGLSEDLINRLSHIPTLRVIARNTVFRYKDKEIDIKEIGEILGVSHLFTGRVRAIGDSLVIGVELTCSADGAQIWGAKYQRQFSEIMALQEELSWTIAEKFAVNTAGMRRLLTTKSPTQDPESYRLYLKGKYCLEKRSESSLRRAIRFFEEAAGLDNSNIYALTEIVECYRLLHAFDYIPYAEFLAATKVVVNTVAKNGGSLEFVEIMYCDLKMLDWKFDEAIVHCQRALVINSNSQRARLRYFDLLLQSRQFGPALEQINRIMTVDPLSSLTNIRIGRLYYLMGRFEDAIGYLNDALELEAENWEALAVRAAVFVETAEFGKALSDFQASLKGQYSVEVIAMIGLVYAKLGNTQKANQVIKKLKALTRILPQHAMKLAYVHLALGQRKEAYEFLEAAYSKHECDLRALTYDPRWEPIRGETRFKNLVKKVGLPVT